MATNSAVPHGPIRVLLVDDDKDDFVITRDLLADIGPDRYQLDWLSSFDEGVQALCDGKHDVYLIDYRLGEQTGLELIATAKTKACFGPVILLTGQSDYEIDQAAMSLGAADYLEKSRLDATLLDRSIRYTLQQWRYETELERQVQERTKALEKANRDLEKEISERKKVAAALQEASRHKDVFLAALAHELRNPLAPIRNAVEIMKLAGERPADHEQARAIIERQVTQLVRLVDDLLDVSRISQGKLRIKSENVNLQEVIQSAIEISRPLLDKANVTFQVELPEVPVMLQGDRVRLAQVFSNLLNNAAKYTDPGGAVTLRMKRADDQALVQVIDTGVGIPPELLSSVFAPFAQIGRTLGRSQGGLGIGLSLVHRLVEMHGGSVEAHSSGLNQGTTFTVYLPAPAPKPKS